MTIISVTHDVESALRYSTHILRLNSDGYFFDTVEKYLALGESEKYMRNSDKDVRDDTRYGDGGFRYKGGDV